MNTPARRRRRDDGGFTLVELTVSIAIFIVVMSIALGEISNGVARSRKVDLAANDDATARLVVDGIVREIRQASTGDPALAVVTAISATSITFHTPDAKQPKHLRRITYRLVAGVLQRSEVVSSNTGAAPWVFPATAVNWRNVLANVTNTDLFTYWTSGSPPTVAVTPSAVSSVSLHIDVRSRLSSAVNSIYRTGIDIRSQR